MAREIYATGAAAYEVRADVDSRGRKRIVLTLFAAEDGEGWRQHLSLEDARKLRVSLARAIDAAERAGSVRATRERPERTKR